MRSLGCARPRTGPPRSSARSSPCVGRWSWRTCATKTACRATSTSSTRSVASLAPSCRSPRRSGTSSSRPCSCTRRWAPAGPGQPETKRTDATSERKVIPCATSPSWAACCTRSSSWSAAPSTSPRNTRATRRRRACPAAAAEALVCALLGTAGAVEARLAAGVRPLGRSVAKAGVLRFLAEAKQPLLLHELAEHEGCVRSNSTQLVDRLEKDGLVRRRSDATDHRSVRAVLTPAGRQAYAKAVRALAQEQRAILSALDEEDAARLRSALQALAR